jgi:hypothetical protein
VVGEAYTKLRYDRRITPRNDARAALGVFGLTGAGQGVFELRPTPLDCHHRVVDLLGRYSDQSFSYIDALSFLLVDDDPRIDRVLTVDGKDFTAYRFMRHILVELP